ncbi:MAG: bifunctional protein-serine/threonine kinase/phosphatase [Gammaproteobacteria bacterium]|nr:bifunctional protein-serine/threonine kinase/phosphatase [Gammaproteobacteria bacterium]MCP5135967.1 bifunctional protein-serine/threonine kinase/phosphatase [Gammaproteobacteria bacterium]
MPTSLRISVGQCSDKGRKALNQDFHGTLIPGAPLLVSKGASVALADGISTSEVSQIASETAVKSFIEDYYATSEALSVKTSAQEVLRAINSWLYAQTRQGPHGHELDRGYVCTFSALVIKSTTAHLFHVGDARICYLSGDRLESLTDDHRLWVTPDKSYLSRALGMRERLEIDYQSYTVEQNDTLILMTDGVYEFASDAVIAAAIHEHPDDLDLAARQIVDKAIENGSDDNLTIQIVRVDQLPNQDLGELSQQAAHLPFPPELSARMIFDGYEIVREVHNSHRSHLYLAIDQESGDQVILKIPSIELRNDADYIEHFLTEEWVARRIENAHVLKAGDPTRKRNFLYVVTEYIDGQTLAQWMHDHPNPELEKVRDIIEQIARGLRALHRQEMIHQDLRPQNVMIDHQGTVKLIDFGSVKVAGIAEMRRGAGNENILGTAQYAAPEYFIGEPGTARSDLFSLGVIAYQMLSGRLPYGTDVAKATSRAAQKKLRYRSVRDGERSIPAWVDSTLRKAVDPNPADRYALLSEFTFDLRHPNTHPSDTANAPLLERNPLVFWKGLSLVLFAVIVALLATHPAIHS